MPRKTPKYQKAASATYKQRREADGYKRASVSFWVKKEDEQEWKMRILEALEALKTDDK